MKPKVRKGTSPKVRKVIIIPNKKHDEPERRTLGQARAAEREWRGNPK